MHTMTEWLAIFSYYHHNKRKKIHAHSLKPQMTMCKLKFRTNCYFLPHVMDSLCLCSAKGAACICMTRSSLQECIDKSKISTGSNMGATKEMHIWRFDLSKPAKIRTWMTTNWTHKPSWINTISESTELQTFIKLTRKKQTTKLTITFFNTQKLHKPQKLGLSVRPHQSGCSPRRRRSSLAVEVTTPCIDPGSRPRAATRLHYSICVQSASLLGAKLISLHDNKMNEVTE